MSAANSNTSAPIRRQWRNPLDARGLSSTSDTSPPPGNIDQGPVLSSSSTPDLENYDFGISSDGASVKKTAWNVSSNEPTADVAAVMGAVSWPALSESAARASHRSVKPPSHGSQDLAGIIEEDISSRFQIDISNSNHSSIPTNGNLTEPAPVQQAPPPSNAGKHGGEHSGSQAQRPNYQRTNNGPIPRVDGASHGNHRRDHGNRRESHGQRVGPFMRGPALNSYFAPPPPPPPFPSTMRHLLHQDMQCYVYHDPLRSLPMVQFPYYPPTPDPDLPDPVLPEPELPEPDLPSMIAKQIEYYFSINNLVTDVFLRKNMDATEGWVSIHLIADFKRIKAMTNDIQLIKDSLKTSNVVEVQGDKVRPKENWGRWPILATIN